MDRGRREEPTRRDPGSSAGSGVASSPGKRTLVESLAAAPQVRRQVDPASPEQPPGAAQPAGEGTGAVGASSGEATSQDVDAAEVSLLGDVGEEPGTPAAAAAEPDVNALDPLLVGGGGRPLPPTLRASLEATAGRDLGEVRIHDGAEAGKAAQALGARAFTLKHNIYFAPGAYDPGSPEGRRLIAHEVGHTLQPEGPVGAGVTAPGDAVEQEAEGFADRAAGDQGATGPRADGEDAGAAAPEGAAAAAAPGGAAAMRPAPAGGAPAPAGVRTRIPCFPGVVKPAFEEDKIRWIDPADHSQGKVWQDDRGYIKNPTAMRLSTLAGPKGKIAGGFENGKFMYVIDDKGEVWVGKRLGKNMPHPTLLGGKDPQVLGAGMVQIEGGKIVKIDNHSGHFQPPRGSLRDAVKGFLKLPKDVFKNFKAESVHFDAAGTESRKPFQSLRMLKLKSFSPTKTINRLRLRYKNDPKFKGRVNGGLKTAGKAGLAIIASLVLQYFLSKWMAELEAEQIRKSLEKLAPQVEAALLASLEEQVDALDALNEVSPDAKVHINIVYRLSWIETHMAGPGGTPMSSEGFAGAELITAEFSQTAIKEDLKFEKFDSCIGSTTKHHQLSMSEEIRVGDLYGEAAEEPEEPAQPGKAGGEK